MFKDKFEIAEDNDQLFVGGKRLYENLNDELLATVKRQLIDPRKIRISLFDFERQDISKEMMAKNIIDSRDYAILSSLDIQLEDEISSNDKQAASLICLGSMCLYAISELLDTYRKDGENLITSITIVESESKDLNASLSIVDLEKVVLDCKANGIQFNLIFNESLDKLTTIIFDYLASSTPMQLYGLGIIKVPELNSKLVELDSWLFSESGLCSRFIGNLGFSTDEINQVINASYNYIARPKAKHISFNAHPYTLEKSLVTGSGPSLDKHLEWIKKNQSYFTIYASSSSVRSLLSNGVQPDFLVVSERNSIIYDELRILIEELPQAKNLTLACSDTVDPRVAALFNNVLFFQRPLSAVSALFSEYRSSALPTSGPESVNAAVEVAYMYGFRKILGIGCDFSALCRDNPRAVEAFGISPRSLNTPVMGNMGRTVFSQPSLLLVKDSLSRLLRAKSDLNFVRSGEGAKLELSQTIDVLDQIQSKEYIGQSMKLSSNELSERMSVIESLEGVDKKMTNLLEALNHYISHICDVVAELDSWNIKIERELTTFLNADLNYSEESLYALSARRMLRQSIYHMLNLVFSARNSSVLNIYKNQLHSSLLLTKDSLTLVFNLIRNDSQTGSFSLKDWSPESLKEKL